MGTYTVRLAATIFVLTALNLEAAERPAAQLSSSGALERAVDDYLSPYVESHNFSGSVLIARHGEVLLRKGYGMANFELSVPNRLETRFHIASITKSFTTAAILLLRDKGRLSLDNPLSRFFPDFPNADRITVEHLLAHTSGLPRLVFFPEYGDKSRAPHTIETLTAWIAAKEPASEPGESYRYSNANYVLLAGIIEKASGQSYGEFLVTHILQPLGMSDTGHHGRAEELIANRASGYVPAGIDALKNAAYHDYSFDAGAGSLYSTVDDLYRWVLARGRVRAVSSARPTTRPGRSAIDGSPASVSAVPSCTERGGTTSASPPNSFTTSTSA